MSPPQKPMEAITNHVRPVNASDVPTNASSAVGIAPIAVKIASIRMCALPLSASAPSQGAVTASIRLEMPFAVASHWVLSIGAAPTVSVCLKNTGKNATITVVAKAEFAQSYSAQENTFCSNSGDFMTCARIRTDVRTVPAAQMIVVLHVDGEGGGPA